MAKEKQNVEPYWGEKLLESYALATDAPTAERRMIMRKNCESCKYDRLKAEICDECYNTSDAPTKWQPSAHYEPDTNADRIRAMSDEELAKFLECFGLCHHCAEHHRLSDLRIYANEKCDEMCEQHCLEWLKQPVEKE
jgi:hypothetical protein